MVPRRSGRSRRVRPASWATIITAVRAPVARSPNSAQPAQSKFSSNPRQGLGTTGLSGRAGPGVPSTCLCEAVARCLLSLGGAIVDLGAFGLTALPVFMGVFGPRAVVATPPLARVELGHRYLLSPPLRRNGLGAYTAARRVSAS